MNYKLIVSLVQKLKENLSKCTEAQQLLFKKMYSHKNLDLSIEEVIDNMDESKLKVATQQVERTLKKRNTI